MQLRANKCPNHGDLTYDGEKSTTCNLNKIYNHQITNPYISHTLMRSVVGKPWIDKESENILLNSTLLFQQSP